MKALYTLVVAALPVVLWYGYSVLRHKRFRQYKDLPQAPPSLIWGHLAVIGEFYKTGDARRHIDYVFREIGETLGMPPIMILDMRPFFWVMCIVFNHDVAEQISRGSKTMPYSVPKSPTLGALWPLVGVHSILTTEGGHWKSLRKRYNAGFAPNHLLTLLPQILDKTPRFLHNLDNFAETGEEFRLEPLCTNLTFDIIATVVMDVDLKAQLPEHLQSELVRLYRKLLFTYTNMSESGLLGDFGPITYLNRRRISRAIDSTLKTIIKDKFDAASISAKIPTTTTAAKKARSVLALSLQETEQLDPLILQQTADQLKTFLIAGHDTTSILLQWCFYELSRSPAALAASRAEHDDLFGVDSSPEEVADLLREEGDEILGRLSYTSAVIKETLRLYPPASTARRAQPGSGCFVKLPDGKDVCLDGMVLYNQHFGIQRNKEVFGESGEWFRPERWLGDLDTSSAHDNNVDGKGGIPASAWRPFERGPRNCIGQELANIEARVILALTVRRYDFEKVGAGKVRRDADGKGVIDQKTGQFEVDSWMFNTRQVTSKPFDGMMMKVRLADKAV